MSTKTTFKRIALVAVAALGFGTLSVVPSTASTAIAVGNSVISAWTGDGLTAGDNGVYSSTVRGLAVGNGVAGIANTVTIRISADAGHQTTDTTTAWADSADGLAATTPGVGTKRAIATVTGGTFATTSVANEITFNTAGTQASVPANNALAYITVNTPTVGDVVVKVYRETAAGSGLYSTTAYETVTFTIGATAINGAYASSKVYAEAAPTASAAAPTSVTNDAFNTDPQAYVATASSVAKAAFKVVQYDAAGVALTASTKAITITTTLGAVGTSDTTPVGSYLALAASTAGSTQNQLLYLFSDGRSGKAVVTIAVNGVTAATYNVTFYGTTIASMTMTPYKPVIAASDGTQVGGNATATDDTSDYAKSSVQFILVLKDANGNDIMQTSPGTTVTSSNLTVATVSAIGGWSLALGGYPVTATAVGTSGTTTITVKDTLTGLISATGTVTVGSKSIASLVFATDATDYKPGDKVTVTLTAKDASGNPIADGVYYNLLTGAVASTQALQTYPFDLQHRQQQMQQQKQLMQQMQQLMQLTLQQRQQMQQQLQHKMLQMQ
jgi:trimeric autotransporter adhesin